MNSTWQKVWRLDSLTLNPEEVEVMYISHNYVLVKGEEHTSYSGGFFDSPEAAFAHEEEEAKRSIRYGQAKMDRIAKARQRMVRS